jgi:hypothetical protein
MSLAEMRATRRELRKDAVKPVSRMRKSDISAEIQRLQLGREETPPVASISSAPAKMQRSAVTSIKKAKELEFPVVPVEHHSKKHSSDKHDKMAKVREMKGKGKMMKEEGKSAKPTKKKTKMVEVTDSEED